MTQLIHHESHDPKIAISLFIALAIIALPGALCHIIGAIRGRGYSPTWRIVSFIAFCVALGLTAVLFLASFINSIL